VTGRRYPAPPPGGRLPWRIRARSWWAGVGQPAWQRWTWRISTVMLLAGPALLATLMLVALAQDRPAPAAGTCTLVGSTWSCTH